MILCKIARRCRLATELVCAASLAVSIPLFTAGFAIGIARVILYGQEQAYAMNSVGIDRTIMDVGTIMLAMSLVLAIPLAAIFRHETKPTH